MIAGISHTAEWIHKKRAEFNNGDPILVEKVIKALTLLEALNKRCNFIFKGGTSLLLLLPSPLRFSIDIDIIMEEKPDNIEQIFQKIIAQTLFTHYEEDERGHTDIPKEHYKFYYESALTGQGDNYILLDIVFCDNPYPKTIEKAIQSPIISIQGKPTSVRVPDINGILGDKLTAFAPKTIGIPIGEEKELEIMKQLHDVGHLFNFADNLSLVSKSFIEVAKAEINFRGLSIDVNDALRDTFHACQVLSLRDQKDSELYDELKSGMQRLESYVFKRYKIDEAILNSAKAAYLSKLLLTDSKKLERFDGEDLSDWLIEDPEFNKLNKIKKTSPEGFYYWYQAVALN